MTPKPFQIGFTGSTLDAILPWLDEQVGDADRVVVAMAGSGKDIAYLARPGRRIMSWDPQVLSWNVVNGVFMEPSECPPPLVRGEVQGYAYANRPLKGMPDDAAELIDHIVVNGSGYDRVCLVKAYIRSTYMGRMTAWATDQTVETMWARYLKEHERLRPYRGLPGTFDHRRGSVFTHPNLAAELRDATLVIDTPKVLNGGKHGDIYSRGFRGLNSILAQSDQDLPAWTEETFRRDMPLLWNGPWRRMILFHATGCRPSVWDLEDMMFHDGVELLPGCFTTWNHRGDRTDVAWVIDRRA